MTARRAARASGERDPAPTSHLREIRRVAAGTEQDDAFPFGVPAIRALDRLDLSAAVTLFVGENGSGKSTLLEAIAAGARLPTVGAEEVSSDETLAAQRRLARSLELVWSRRVHRGFFLRAEDFFGFTRRLTAIRAEMTRRLGELDAEYEDRSKLARTLAEGPLRASLGEMTRLYGADLDAYSHGESFLKLFQARLHSDGLYLLDEPEAALSPQSQLGLLAMIKEMLAQRCQFILATHSPILLASPGARIYSFDSVPIAEAAYDDLPHVTLTRAFLADPAAFLRRL